MNIPLKRGHVMEGKLCVVAFGMIFAAGCSKLALAGARGTEYQSLVQPSRALGGGSQQ